jgi:hypothetical protein
MMSADGVIGGRSFELSKAASKFEVLALELIVL